MKATLEYKEGFLYVVEEKDGATGVARKWFPVRRADYFEAQTLHGRPVTSVNQQEGIYVDEEGNVFQLMDKGETKPIELERLSATEKTELEVQLEASLNGRKANARTGGTKRLLRDKRSSGRKQQALQAVSSKPEARSAEAPPAVEASAPTSNIAASEAPMQLNLRQKLAEVRRRIGYVQKRGHNERHNYSYVTAADIAGAVGDILAELGVVVVPRLESIAHEPVRNGRTDGEHLTHVVMSYSFVDVDTADEITVKVAGEGVDAGDKAPYKAMTGALKYALLQSFLLATGDDPEDEHPDARYSARNPERLASADEVRELEKRINDTGTDLERVLAYYKVTSLEAMTETTYRRAVELLNRKLAKLRNQETVHAQD
ncbi:MAG: ERF family protein [Candidatus Binataceae bacterium]